MSEPLPPEAALHRHFVDTVSGLAARPPRDPELPLRPGSTLTGRQCLALFDAQLGSRHLDLAARRLRARGHGYYTIGSAGHEGNAAVAAALRPDDPALLHYRSGAFYLVRAADQGVAGPRDVLLGMMAARDEPIAGGRHKVFGHPELAIIPQTSTIASHLPRAVGLAFAVDRARKLGLSGVWRPDAVVVCSFGDASTGHSTAAGAISTAASCAYQRLPMPLLLVCEDNGLGISVRTPPGWIRAAYGERAGLRYFAADGCDVDATHDAATRAAAWVREHRSPAFLHLRTVRLLGHAGSDVESAYRTPAEMAADLARDPVVATARLLVEAGVCTPGQVLDHDAGKRAEVDGLAAEAVRAPRLAGAAEVTETIAPRDPRTIAAFAAYTADPDSRRRAFGGRLPEEGEPLTLAQSINAALADALAARPDVLVFGEDVGRKGGVYGVTRGLVRRFGAGRVFDTPLDEQAVLGLALGAGLAGLLPVPEIQYLAYLHNAADQIRGEAATLAFFSQGRFRNPMVVRIASYAYQRGFGGHFHNDSSVAALRDIPGLVVASPARPEDAVAMLRTCLGAASAHGSVCVFLEPIALYHTRDLQVAGDGGWLAGYRPPGRWAPHAPIGRGRTHGSGGDLTVITFGNGLWMSLRAAERLRAEGIDSRVLDLRWIVPLPVDDIVAEARATGRVLVADETRRGGGVSEGVVTALVDHGFTGRVARVTSEDSFVPLGPAAESVLLSEPAVIAAARRLTAAG